MDLKKIWNAFIYSLSGLKFLINERAFVQELVLGIGVLVFLFFFKPSYFESLYIISSYFLVLITEALNTGIETLTNRISLEQNPLSKKAKDIGSAAVFLTLTHLFIVLSIIVYKKF